MATRARSPAGCQVVSQSPQGLQGRAWTVTGAAILEENIRALCAASSTSVWKRSQTTSITALHIHTILKRHERNMLVKVISVRKPNPGSSLLLPRWEAVCTQRWPLLLRDEVLSAHRRLHTFRSPPPSYRERATSPPSANRPPPRPVGAAVPGVHQRLAGGTGKASAHTWRGSTAPSLPWEATEHKNLWMDQDGKLGNVID